MLGVPRTARRVVRPPRRPIGMPSPDRRVRLTHSRMLERLVRTERIMVRRHASASCDRRGIDRSCASDPSLWKRKQSSLVPTPYGTEVQKRAAESDGLLLKRGVRKAGS